MAPAYSEANILSENERRSRIAMKPAMRLPFAPNRFRAYEIEFGAGGQRLARKFLLGYGQDGGVNCRGSGQPAM
jgi:hypothetical protein